MSLVINMKDAVMEKIFPEIFDVVSSEIQEQTMIISLKSNVKSVCCPNCNHISTTKHSTRTRICRDLPISSYAIELHISYGTYRCENINCTTKFFPERFDGFLLPMSRRTVRLDEEIFKLAIVHSSEQTARDLVTTMHFSISGDTILRLIRQKAIIEIDYDSIVAVGIDDFCTKKGQNTEQ